MGGSEIISTVETGLRLLFIVLTFSGLIGGNIALVAVVHELRLLRRERELAESMNAAQFEKRREERAKAIQNARRASVPASSAQARQRRAEQHYRHRQEEGAGGQPHHAPAADA